MVMYTILSIFGYGLYSLLTDFTQVHYDTAIDKELCDVGPEFMDAGVRFYEKLLKKNISVRNLLGDASFSAKGNVNSFIRQKTVPLTIRKSYFELRLNQLKEQIESEAKKDKGGNAVA